MMSELEVLLWGLFLLPSGLEVLLWGLFLLPSGLEVLLWGLFLLPSGTMYLGARAEARDEAVE